MITLPKKRLRLTLRTGSELVFNMQNRLNTNRFYPLNDDAVFNSVTTDGFCLHFDVKRNYALYFTLQEAIQMTISDPGELPGWQAAEPSGRGSGGDPGK